jgi:hypothetical protein
VQSGIPRPANGDYEIPRVHVQRIADKVLNGWQLTAIADWQTGFPFTIFSGFDNSFSAIGEDRADLTVPSIGDAVLPGRSHRQSSQQWFDVNDFIPNAIGTFGNTGKNALRGPRYFNSDLAIIKNTKVGERVSVAFRAEFFNAFNNVNFGLPGNNVAAGVAGGFGQITGTAGSGSYNGPTSYGTAQPRIIQFGLKISF